MPHPEHNIAASEFERHIYQQHLAIGLQDEVDSLRSTTVCIGDWSKKADACWAPALQSTHLSFALEIGLSESWLETKGSTVQGVVTLKINRDRPEIILRSWELRPQQYSVTTRASPRSASSVQEIRMSRLNNATQVTGDLIVPFQHIVGRPVNPNNSQEQDLTVTQQNLRTFSDKVWRKQRFL